MERQQEQPPLSFKELLAQVEEDHVRPGSPTSRSAVVVGPNVE
jgi:hypothetical protein